MVSTYSNFKWSNEEINQATKEKFKFKAHHMVATADRSAKLKIKGGKKTYQKGSRQL